MQAVRTRYLPPTPHGNSRIQAKCGAMTTYFEFVCERPMEWNHKQALLKLATEMKWYDEWWSGGFGNDMYWVRKDYAVTLYPT